MDIVQPPGALAPGMELRKRLLKLIAFCITQRPLNANRRHIGRRKFVILRVVCVLRGELIQSALPALAIAVVLYVELHLWMQRLPNWWPAAFDQAWIIWAQVA